MDPDSKQLLRPTQVLDSFDVYETRTSLYFVGSNESSGHYRVMRIDRTTKNTSEMVVDNGTVYTKETIAPVVADIRAKPAKLLVGGVCGMLGLVRFTKGFYVSVVTRRKPVALLGGHYVYHVEDTRLLSVASRPERSEAEDRHIRTFRNVDLTKNFYYSHTYDITHTLQRNVRMAQGAGKEKPSYNGMFVWNYQLICNATYLNVKPEWTIALVHGYVDQSRLAILGRDVFVTLVARRSRVFAGVRYLKRGVNGRGFVANDVETEQIVSTMELTSFDQPFGEPFSNPYFTSYVQHRGSIPLFWSQDTSGMVPKPPIEINVRDPYFVEAGRHFDSLFQRYGTPVIVLNLIKIKERTKRESRLGEEFSEGLRYLNQFLPKGRKIRYVAWDMSRAKKNREEDVLAILEVIAEETLALTGFFHNGPELYSNFIKRRDAGDEREFRQSVRWQTGIVRSNCIDCLDRTNAAQSIIGKVVLAHQLYELGQIDEPHLSFNTDAAMIIEEMYHDLGDTIALQYGGSHLVNTVQTYRRNNNWRSHSRDVVEALRRYYSNSLLDMERQEAITMFLERSLLEECKGDDCVGVNNLSPLGSPIANQLSTLTTSQWWTTLGDEGMDEVGKEKADSLEKDSKDDTSHRDDYWNEYYRPHEYTSLDSLFVGNLNSTASLHPNMDIQNMPSPFVDRSAKTARTYSHVRRVQQEPQWLKSETDEYTDPTRVSRQEIYDKLCAKTVQPQVILPIGIGGWITDGVSSPLQEPQVSRQELEEYKKYVHQFDDLKKWIVQPSTKLYADVHNAGVRTPERGSAKSLAHAEPPATTSKIKMDTGGLGVLALERQRSQTPTPGMQAHSLMSLSATLPARPGSRKITPLEILQRSPSLRASGRQRANTSSVERGSLWGLWPNVPSLGSKRSSLVGQQGSGGGDFAAMLQRRASHGQLAKHDRSRSLDFANASALPPRQPAFGQHDEKNEAVVTEPRVSEADLRVYQEYVKMRKAFQGQLRV